MVSERELGSMLRDLVDADPEHGLVILTPDRRVLYSNVAARSYLRDGTPRGDEALLPEVLERTLESFVARVQTQRGPSLLEVYYPSDSDRRLKVTFEAVRRDEGLFIVLRAESATPWAEPTVRRLQSRFGLTVREAQVAAGVAKGHTNAEVAGQLGIVEKTVKNVLMSVFTKCTVRNRVELALRAYDAPVPHLREREAKKV
jgi:DNA-binding NarL/FixJ family response regulator